MFEHIDIYCERTDSSFWAEPLNAISNAAFLIAAYWAWQKAEREERLNGASIFLMIMVGLIGIGSFLFHTFAQQWSLLADVIPIAVFIYVYLLIAIRQFFALSFFRAVLAFAALIILDAAVVRPLLPDEDAMAIFNGSDSYLFPVIAMLVIAAALVVTNRPGALYLALTALIFLGSLTLRTLDLHLCEAFPIGTHPAWHVLNALVLYRLLRMLALVQNQPAQAKPTADEVH